jgi:hypothetical protein
MFKTWISISFKTAQISFHPMAKYMELQEIICKTARFLSPPHGKMCRIAGNEL